MSQRDAEKAVPEEVEEEVSSLRPKRKHSDVLTTEQLEAKAEVDDFMCRLRTYQNCFGRPKIVSPWLCARFGWMVVGRDLLQCVTCGEYLSAFLPRIGDQYLRTKCMQRLRTGIVESHAHDCRWRSTPVAERECAPEADDATVVLQDLKSRCDSLRQVAVPISCADVVSAEKLAVKEELDLLKRAIFHSFDEKLLFLAVVGWTAPKRNLTGTPSSDAAGHDFSEKHPNVSQKQKQQKRRVLDPQEQHQNWCPWLDDIQVMTVGGVEGESLMSHCLPTWRCALLQLCAKIRYRDQEEGTVRQLLSEMLSAVEHGLMPC